MESAETLYTDATSETSQAEDGGTAEPKLGNISNIEEVAEAEVNGCTEPDENDLAPAPETPRSDRTQPSNLKVTVLVKILEDIDNSPDGFIRTTAKGLAEHHGVSIPQMNQAMSALARSGAIQSKSAGRLGTIVRKGDGRTVAAIINGAEPSSLKHGTIPSIGRPAKGARQPLTYCVYCGEPSHTKGARFCRACGKPLD